MIQTPSISPEFGSNYAYDKIGDALHDKQAFFICQGENLIDISRDEGTFQIRTTGVATQKLAQENAWAMQI